MPIQMVDDQKNPQSNNSGGNRQKKSGSKALLPILLQLFSKNPKLLILIVLGGAAYFFFQKKMGKDPEISEQLVEIFSQGLLMDKEVYDQSEIYEPLATDYKSDLPVRVSLEKYCPPRRNQGSQGSCVGWSSSYAARTILESRATGQRPEKVAFSPSSLYNQIKLPNCNGAYIHNAMEVMHEKGVLPYRDFAYNEYDCDKQPSTSQLQKAANFTTKGFQRLWEQHGKPDIIAIKQNLAQGAPVVIGMLVGGSFMNAMRGKQLWTPTRSEYSARGFGGHAMCVIGYDDQYEGGAFQIMNSWGDSWGDRGFCWVRYQDFNHFTKEAYGLYPMGSKSDETGFPSLELGLVNNATSENIQLKQVNQNLFRTTSPVEKGTRFKIEVTNDQEVYTYVFGEETDGSSYVLFPYTEKHSPYCGIVGTRLFPRNQSLMADDIGSVDRMAIVVSTLPIDYTEMNKAINKAHGSYIQKVQKAFSEVSLSPTDLSVGKTIKFDLVAPYNKHLVPMVIEVDKH